MKYYVDIEHKGLGKFRRVTGPDRYVVNQKAAAQRQNWDEQWSRKCEIEKRQQQRAKFAKLQVNKKIEATKRAEKAQKAVADKKAEAAKRTEEAQQAVVEISAILINRQMRLNFDWEPLYYREWFSEREPLAPSPRVPIKPFVPLRPRPPEPPRPHPSAAPSGFLGWLFPSIQRRREVAASLSFASAFAKWEVDHAKWREAVHQSERGYEAACQASQLQYEAECRACQLQYEADCQAHELCLGEWKARKLAFDHAKGEHNMKAEAFRYRYKAKDGEAVTEYVNLVLPRSHYPDYFPKQWQTDFIAETGVLIVDYDLPALDALPTLKAVKYVQSRDELEESYLKENEIALLYDSAMYQTSLRTLHELFGSDEADALKSVTFNGWVNFIDKSNGKPTRACIMSLQATKRAFQQINLNAVDPKVCFHSLKGVGSAKLAGMSPVVPILRLNKTDKRFVAAHDVIESVAEITNIAAIPWESFEYLVRDIFEKEFSGNGGEVKITRASRDHGVDAVAFDPDPIRGGKIVIQAKRYTNVVGVSAVRDLYGTLINEGANRGILVTTSQYGPDSYEFAKDKPITLLDGGNLLSLLDRHGHKARIDLAEAKRLGASREER